MQRDYEELPDIKAEEGSEPNPWIWPEVCVCSLQLIGIVVSFVFIGLYDTSDCGTQMENMIMGSAIYLCIDTLLVFTSILIIKRKLTCIKAAVLAKITLFQYIFRLFTTLFYIAWSIFAIVTYTEHNDCDQDLSKIDALSFALMLYFAIITGLMLLSWTCKLCLCCMAATSLTSIRETMVGRRTMAIGRSSIA